MSHWHRDLTNAKLTMKLHSLRLSGMKMNKPEAWGLLVLAAAAGASGSRTEVFALQKLINSSSCAAIMNYYTVSSSQD